jgi:hypothetical protein
LEDGVPLLQNLADRWNLGAGEPGDEETAEGAARPKRHILVDTEGLVVEAKVHSAKVPDQDGIRRLLAPARSRLPRLSHLWVDAGYRGRGKEWAEGTIGVGVEVDNRTAKPPPEKVLRL